MKLIFFFCAIFGYAAAACENYSNRLFPDLNSPNVFVLRTNPATWSCSGIPKRARNETTSFLNRRFPRQSQESPSPLVNFETTDIDAYSAVMVIKQSQEEYDEILKRSETLEGTERELKTSLQRAGENIEKLPWMGLFLEIQLCLRKAEYSGGDTNFKYGRSWGPTATATSLSVDCFTMKMKQRKTRFIFLSIIWAKGEFEAKYEMVPKALPEGECPENSFTLRPEMGHRRNKRETSEALYPNPYIRTYLIPCAESQSNCWWHDGKSKKQMFGEMMDQCRSELGQTWDQCAFDLNLENHDEYFGLIKTYNFEKDLKRLNYRYVRLEAERTDRFYDGSKKINPPWESRKYPIPTTTEFWTPEPTSTVKTPEPTTSTTTTTKAPICYVNEKEYRLLTLGDKRSMKKRTEDRILTHVRQSYGPYFYDYPF